VIVGLIIGVLSGALASTILKLRIRGIPTDAFLGAIGFIATLIGCPLIVSGLIAVFLPALHQFVRFKRMAAARK